ncbi:uncharacterized protein LOC114326897 isoform X2 [Diabrotica virgifera virgifera]|uniref:SWIM-type domain-containing protein n=1 Tax=Diabrotica virgifera virgifera TaxID=50390 RepID=A0ABM5IEM0_DIAVI|nr:uncharacterized protein LOC114326897 isoform X2 [Diabrotica virgifera virgifera]
MEISVSDIVEYCGDSKRPLIEGEAVFDANHIFVCGIKSKSTTTVEIFALCLQSSKIHDQPHEIDIKVSGEGTQKTIKCACTCKAGAGQKCKHIIAVLLYVHREKITNLDDLGCTDLQQKWGKLKTHSKELYKDEPMENFCHVKKTEDSVNKSGPSKEVLQACALNLIKAHPTSEACLHLKRRNAFSNEYVADDLLQASLIHAVINVDVNCSSSFQKMPHLSEEEQVFYKKNILLSIEDAVDLCSKTLGQSNELWKHQRKLRITGSICYNLYTFHKNRHNDSEWFEKINKILYSSFTGNQATLYGVKTEHLAKEKYSAIFNNKIENVGLVVNPKLPWLGFSPDGIVYKDCLIEIKCPVIGQKITAAEAAKTMKCFAGEFPQEFHLKSSHQYYGQIQLGMFLLNLSKCHFCVYSSFDDSISVIEIPYDEEFVGEMINALKLVYFKYFLPTVIKYIQ